MQDPNPPHLDLQDTAKEIMQQHGFQPDFPAKRRPRARTLGKQPVTSPPPDVRDMRNLLWSSIDNDTSRDLDQIEVAEQLPNSDVKILVGIDDVDTLVAR